jgi:small subunit ribosomal protein S20
MAFHKSAKKMIRKIARRTAINHSRLSRIRTFVKKAEVSLKTQENQEEILVAKQSFVEAQKELMRGVTKGVLHRNTAARKVSRLAKRLNVLA